MRIGDATGMDQDLGTRVRRTLDVHGVIHGEGRKNLRTIVTADQARLQSSLITHPIRLCQGRIYSKRIPHRKATNAEHQVNKDDKVHHHPGRLLEGSILAISTKRLVPRPICRIGRQGQLLARGRSKWPVRIEGLPIRTLAMGTDQGEMMDLTPPAIGLSQVVTTMLLSLLPERHSQDLPYLLDHPIQPTYILQVPQMNPDCSRTHVTGLTLYPHLIQFNPLSLRLLSLRLCSTPNH